MEKGLILLKSSFLIYNYPKGLLPEDLGWIDLNLILHIAIFVYIFTKIICQEDLTKAISQEKKGNFTCRLQDVKFLSRKSSMHKEEHLDIYMRIITR